MQRAKKATQNRATFKPLPSLNFNQESTFEVMSNNQRAQEIEPAKR
jgi:hypothetical protein